MTAPDRFPAFARVTLFANLAVTLTSEETAFYKAVLALVRNEVRRWGDRVTSFHLIRPALRMSSSLPVVANAVREGKWGGFDEIIGLCSQRVADA